MHSSHVRKWYHNMLLVLSVTFHCHYYTWGRMCSTVPFQFSLLKGYIHISIAHQIGSINLAYCYHIFRICVPERSVASYSFTYCIFIPEKQGFCFHYYCAIYDECKLWMRFVLQIVFVCLYITPSQYHHCANLSEHMVLIKCLSGIFCRVCE